MTAQSPNQFYGDFFMDKKERLRIFGTNIAKLLKANEGSFVIFEEKVYHKYVQFAGSKEASGWFIIDIPLIELSKDEEKRLLSLNEFSKCHRSRDIKSNEPISFQIHYTQEDVQKAAQLTEEIFIEVFKLAPDYNFKVELILT